MIQYVTRQEFHDQFTRAGRNNFSYEMREALFDYLEQIEIDTGKNITLDVVSLCCDFFEVEGGDDEKEYVGFGEPLVIGKDSRLFETR